MTKEIINTCEYYKICESACGGTLEDTELCSCYQLYKQLKRLEQENKELKKDVQLFKCLDTFGENECHCACRCLGNEFCEDADKKINKYRSALKEIKKIITTDCKRCTAECDCDDDCTRYKIKNKINEVLGC